MSLEQRLADPVFLEKTVVSTIKETVEFARWFCTVREHAGVLDEQYEHSKSFLKDYNRCKVYGATPDFRNDLLGNMLIAKSGRVSRKSVPYLLLAAAGAASAYMGYNAENSFLVMAGIGASLGALVTAFFLVPKCEYQKTLLIYQAMHGHPDVVDKALKNLYKKEKNV